MSSTPWRRGSVKLEVDTSIEHVESATVPGGAPAPGRGKVWVRSDSPNVLMFTDDDGNDTVLGGGDLAAAVADTGAGSAVMGSSGGPDTFTWGIVQSESLIFENSTTNADLLTLTPAGGGDTITLGHGSSDTAQVLAATFDVNSTTVDFDTFITVDSGAAGTTVVVGDNLATGTGVHATGGSLVLDSQNAGSGVTVATADAAGASTGPISLTVGNVTGATADNGGDITISGGDTTNVGGSGDGGSVTLTPGTAAGSGSKGSLVLDYATFPAADGSNGEVLTTNGAGALSWAAAGGGSSVTAGPTGIVYESLQFFIDAANPTSYDGSSSPTDVTDLRGTYSSAGTVSNVSVDDAHFSFNGTTSSINMGTLPAALEDIFDGGGSLEFWVRPASDGEGGSGRFAETTDSGLEGWLFFVQDESAGLVRIGFTQHFTTTQGFWRTDRDFAINEWTHVVITYDASSTANDPTFWINGVEYNVAAGNVTEINTPSGSLISDSGNDLYVGNRSLGDRTWDGDIDRFLMYDRVLSFQEVSLLRREGFSRFAPSVLGFDSLTGSVTEEVVLRAGDHLGNAAGSFVGGSLTLRAGNSDSTFGSSSGGDLTIRAGSSTVNGPPGKLTVLGGDGHDPISGGIDAEIGGGTALSNGGGLTLFRGTDHSGSGAPGDTIVRGGDQIGSGNAPGGDLGLSSGHQRGGGVPSRVIMRSAGPLGGTASSTGDILITTQQSDDPSGLFGAQGGTNTDTGDITITTGPVGATAGESGAISLSTGSTSAGSGNIPGDISITAGTITVANNNARGGDVSVTAGDGNATANGGGGDITVTAGDNNTTGTITTGRPGAVTITAGDENGTGAGAAVGGAVTVNAGDGLGTNTEGGTVTVNAGAGTGTEDGGSIVLNPGTAGGTGTDGEVTINGKLTVTGLIDPTGLVLDEQASVPFGTTPAKGTLWVRNDTPNVLVFTDDAGTPHDLTGGGGVTDLQGAYDGGGIITTDATGGDFSVTGTEVIEFEGSSITLDASSASNFTVDGANLTLSTTTSGTLAVDSAGSLDIDAAGGVSVDTASATGFGGAANITLSPGDATNGGAGHVEAQPGTANATENWGSFRIRNVSGFTDQGLETRQFSDQIATGTGTGTDVVELASLSTNGRNVMVAFYFSAVDNSDDSAVREYYYIRSYYRASGTVTAMPSTIENDQNTSGSGSVFDWEFQVYQTGNDIRLRVRTLTGSSFTLNVSGWWQIQYGGASS